MRRIRIGTRGSPLAVIQAQIVAGMLEKSHPEAKITVIPIKTKGDKQKKVALWKVGGKGLFVKEIEEALTDGDVDVAVHSMKDVPYITFDGLVIGAVPKREDPRDALVIRKGIDGADQIPNGAVLGTSSLRRRAIILSLRPDIDVVALRGNVETRVRKVKDKKVDAVILAMAGIMRLGGIDLPFLPLSPEDFIPAAGQGALAVQVRERDQELIFSINDEESMAAVFSERAFLSTLGATCYSAVGAFAEIKDGTIHLIGRVYSPDGKKVISGEILGDIGDFSNTGKGLAEDLIKKGAKNILDISPME